MTVLEVIQKSADFLAKKGVDSPRLQVELLLAHLLKLPRMKLYLNFERVLTPKELDDLRELVKRRGQREPLQHITGSVSFCGLEIAVNRHVLVPRPETELLAELGWQFLNGEGRHVADPDSGTAARRPSQLEALDFGTGSGCLAIALATKSPTAKITALDVSPEALAIAKKNAEANKVLERIEFRQGDGFAALNHVGQASSLSPSKNKSDTGETSVLPDTPTSVPAMPFVLFDPSAPIAKSGRHLPHWRQAGCTYFVTFRLADSIPQDKMVQWQVELRDWLRRNPEPRTPEQEQEYAENFAGVFHRWLDDGMGQCWMRQPEVSTVVEEALRFFDGQRYQLGHFVVMPNHVHVLLRALAENQLSEILHSWKSFTAKKINEVVGREGGVWQDESFDSIVRNEAALEKFSSYIRENPAKAHLPDGQFRLGHGSGVGGSLVGQASSLSPSQRKSETGGTPVLQFDLIVSNPPYIATAEIETLQPEVRDHDPRLALDGGADGLDFYRRLAAEAAAHLKPGGRLMLEFGDGQAAELQNLFSAQKWVVEAVKDDYSHRARILILRR